MEVYLVNGEFPSQTEDISYFVIFQKFQEFAARFFRLEKEIRRFQQRGHFYTPDLLTAQKLAQQLQRFGL